MVLRESEAGRNKILWPDETKIDFFLSQPPSLQSGVVVVASWWGFSAETGEFGPARKKV